MGVDRTLLDVLPSEVDGIPVAFDEAASAEFAAESGSSGRTESVAYAVAADPARRDLVVAAVSRLRAGVFEEGLFRDWRDTYDREVCAAAGGVHGNAEAEIGTRTVYIGSCADGSRTYHAWLPGRRAIVSVFSAGERQLGERLVSGLQEPTR